MGQYMGDLNQILLAHSMPTIKNKNKKRMREKKEYSEKQEQNC